MHNKNQNIDNNFKGKSILSIDQFDTESIKTLFITTEKIEQDINTEKINEALKGKIISLLFFEPSTRTFSSFASAVKRLCGSTLDFQNMSTSSISKGETIEDTIKVMSTYSDAIIIRHPEMGTAEKASLSTNTPVINAGDGIGEHPTQALLDLYTIYNKFGSLDNLTILMAGDILNGRTLHSLLRGLTLYKNNTIYLISPESLKLTPNDRKNFETKGLRLIEIDSVEQIPNNADVWYWTRVQKERFSDLNEYEKVKLSFVLTPQILNTYGKEKMLIMHPLPRVGEIDPAIDDDKRAVYLTDQVKSGLYIRMALLTLILGGTI